jgi:hypothetical protein
MSVPTGILDLEHPDPSECGQQEATMTEVLETEVLDTELQGDTTIREALDLIDQGLGGISDRNLVSTSEIADLLLDVRMVLSKLDAQISTN